MSHGIADRGTHAWTPDEETSRGFIRRALEAVINFFDTANHYCDGTSEEMVRMTSSTLGMSTSRAP